jgi:tRNA(fMet)-specific endonuclease VapC
MSGFLVDTKVLSEVLKRRPSPSVMGHLRAVPPAAVLTSVICVMELRFGAARQPDGVRLWARIEREVLSRVTVLPFDAAASLRAGEVRAHLEAAGTPIGLEDIMIGATALSRGLTVASRNTRDLGRIAGLAVVNWWM